MAPLGAAAVAGLGFLVVLQRMQAGKFDPRGVPTMLIGKHVPPFELPGITAGGFSSDDLLHAGRPVLVNFWASWCAPCREEHPELMKLKASGVPVWGIAYKDTLIDARRFLAENGDPFQRSARDDPGRVAIDWGITGVPESFVVDAQGIVRWHMAGPLTPAIVSQQLMPAMARAVS
ncbi:MAG: DsbE family thiol:disulfide interchange protein [Rhodospirillales bacterium]|nr:DsbE family thiol:disulfide interchange protein [Rhodospirillales bacterium]MDE2575918.1 DsbE family thiol:disulfide interchange protein [Rhodospirillales bacterium]